MKIIKFVGLFLLLAALWSGFTLYTAFYGWWMTPVAPPAIYDDFYQWAVAEVKTRNAGNTAFVLIEDGIVKKEFYAPDGVNKNTLFPTASFSKWITAISTMALVQAGRIDLDEPITSYLTRWKLPASDFDNDAVTVRRLLSHTAGLTDQLGFGDYTVEETLPSIEDSLRNPRASRGEANIEIGMQPGTEFLYSGGGYLVLQLVVEEVTGVTYAEHARRTVLEPADMARSNFDFLGDQVNASASYELDGSAAPSYQYASDAATGFNSSTADLSKLVLTLLQKSSAVSPLNNETLAAMREPHGFVSGLGVWGLGTILYVETPTGDYVFGHDGANDPALNATVRVNPDNADAIVVLVSGHPSLATNIGSEWVLWQTGYPDILSTARTLRSALVPTLVGILIIGLLVLLLARIGKGN